MSVRWNLRWLPALAALGITILACNLPGAGTPEPPTSVIPAAPPATTLPGGEPAPTRAAPPPGDGAVYYIRPDGGSVEQCRGLADAPYPGSGSDQPCAWDHPFRALPPGGSARIAGGDTLYVASGSYQMGYGAPGSDACDQGGSFDCTMPALPSGPDAAHPTRLLGAGWDGSCPDPPELWGSGRPWYILNLDGTSHVQVACFEITDHSGCVENHSGGLACERDNPPYGDWAVYGLFAQDSSDAWLSHLNIHGLASGGVHAGRLSDWTLEDVRIAGNGSVGWDGDLWDDGQAAAGYGDANSGQMVFRRWVVEWNGCGETYPDGEPTGCWAQEAGGYGDGVGTGATGGDWLIEDSAFLYNTSDGLDLLYHTLGGSITLTRVRAEGNAGNQIKVTGPVTIQDSLLVGNCAFFEGKPFTYLVDQCRAAGNTLGIFFLGGEQASITNTTIYGQGDGLVGAGPREEFHCTGAERIIARNNLFIGDQDYFDPGDITFSFYQENCDPLLLDSDYNLYDNVKNVECGQTGPFTASGAHDLCAAAQIVGPLSGLDYNLRLAPGSPALGAGDPAFCTASDLLGTPRPGGAACDLGAYEMP